MCLFCRCCSVPVWSRPLPPCVWKFWGGKVQGLAEDAAIILHIRQLIFFTVDSTWLICLVIGTNPSSTQTDKLILTVNLTLYIHYDGEAMLIRDECPTCSNIILVV